MVVVGALTALATLALALPLVWKWQLGMRRCAIWLAAVGFGCGLLTMQVVAGVVLALAISVAVLAYRFYRDPQRRSPEIPGAIVSPADGEVVYVRRSRLGSVPVSEKHGRAYVLQELAQTALADGEAVVVGIAMSFLDVHVNRAPIAGRITRRTHVPGGFRSLRHPDAVLTNERATTLIERDGFQVAVVQIASRLVRQIVGFVREGDTVGTGQRLGVIRLGSQVDVVLPARDDLRIAVQPGDHVRAGESMLAQLEESPSPASLGMVGVGAVVIGSDFRGLGVVRSLARHGIPTVLIDAEPRSAWFSRYVRRRLRWHGSMGVPEFADFLLESARTLGLSGWVLLPLQDEVVELVAREHDKLGAVFKVVTPPWSIARWALDKRLLQQLAIEAGVAYPRTWSLEQSQAIIFPAVLKPRLSAGLQQSHRRKAIAVQTPQHLASTIGALSGAVPPSELMVQELIPGAGESQFSVAALCRDGTLVCAMTARRRRQYPIDFGLSSCFVEAVEVSELLDPAARLVAAMGLSGLVEIEFKHDRRDGQYKLLDINIRPWGWLTLCAACGLDFAYLGYREAIGDRVAPVEPIYGARWRRLITDLVAAGAEMRAGILTPLAYLRSFKGSTVASVFDRRDPMPGLGDIASAIIRLARFRMRRPVRESYHPIEEVTHEPAV